MVHSKTTVFLLCPILHLIYLSSKSKYSDPFDYGGNDLNQQPGNHGVYRSYSEYLAPF